MISTNKTYKLSKHGKQSEFYVSDSSWLSVSSCSAGTFRKKVTLEMDYIKALTDLGYKLNRSLTIVINDDVELLSMQQEISELNITDVQQFVQETPRKWELLDEKVNDVTIAGYEFAQDTWNFPSLADVARRIILPLGNILKDKIALKEGQYVLEEAADPYDEINSIFKHFTQAYLLHPVATVLTAAKEKIKHYPSLFKVQNRSLEDLRQELLWIEEIERAAYIPLRNLKQLESDGQIIESLKQDFISIETPDRKQTLLDRKQSIQQRLRHNTKMNQGEKTEDDFTVGYLYGIRGQNPSVWEMVLENAEAILLGNPNSFYSKYELEHLPDNHLKNILDTLLSGYAHSYFLAYLENEAPGTYLQQANDAENIKAEKGNASLALKWGGQNNQLYALVRYLKSQNLLLNTYIELAAFLQSHVDVLQSTSIDTIRGQLTRDQHLPKATHKAGKYHYARRYAVIFTTPFLTSFGFQCLCYEN